MELIEYFILTTIWILFIIHADNPNMMHFGKSKLLWVIMAVVMLLMFSQGFSSDNMMYMMVAAIAILVLIFLMKGKTPNQ